MLEVWKKQFSIANFSLGHEDPNVFVTSQWQKNPKPSVCYLVYRMFLTLFFIISLILSVVDERNLDKPYMFRVKWLIYLTNWGFFMCTLQAALCTIMLSSRFYASRKERSAEQGNNNRLYKVYWATNIIATDASFAITVLYWAIIYDGESMPMDYLNILVHATNSAAMFVEFCMVSHPVKLGHCYLSMLFGTTYSIFTLIYYFAGGTSRDELPNIYKVIDWTKPISTSSICIGALIFLVIIHCCSYVLYRVRIKVASKIFKTDELNEKADIQITDLKF